jgi:hypothetical protein
MLETEMGIEKENKKGEYEPFTEENKEGERARPFIEMLATMQMILKEYPVILPEPALENLILDTIPNYTDIKVPFPAFYIDKKFKFGDGYIIGIFVEDPRELMYKLWYEPEKTRDEIDAEIYNRHGKKIEEWLSPMGFYAIYHSTEDTFLITADSMKALAAKASRFHIKVLKEALKYACNVSNLITTRVNLNNPIDTKREVRLIPRYPDGKKTKERQFSTIRLFGELKKYMEDYNKEKRKYSNNEQKTVIVRGHWRFLQSERYTNKRNQHIWIIPYIRGMNKELHSRLIKLQE